MTDGVAGDTHTGRGDAETRRRGESVPLSPCPRVPASGRGDTPIIPSPAASGGEGQGEGGYPAHLAERIRQIRLVAFDFDGVFTDNSVYVLQDGTEAVRCCRGDGIGLRRLERAGVQTVVISTEPNPVVSARCRKLKIRCIQGCEDKRGALESVMKELDISLAQVAFVGNDVNDLPCLASVGLPVVVQDAHPEVVPYGRYRTKTPGGYGAVREVCDLFARVMESAVGNRE